MASDIIDFSWLGKLPEAYEQGAERARNSEFRQAFSGGLPRSADGQIDYAQAADIAARIGNPEMAFKLAPMAEQQRAAAEFSKMFGGTGAPPTAPAPVTAPPPSRGPIESGPRPDTARYAPSTPGTMPSYNGEPPRPKVASSSKVIGDDEAVASGLYESPTTVAQRPTPPQQPAARPAIPTAPAQNPVGGNIPALVAATANPNLPAVQREMAKTMLGRALKDAELTNEQKDYLWFKAQGGTDDFTTWMRDNKRAGAITSGETSFEQEFGKKQADRWNGYIAEGDKAAGKLTDITQMREISRRVGSQGAWAGVKEALGPYAEALGIDVNNLSDIQAFSSIIQRLAPQNRVAGSGSTSDVEFKGMLKAMPQLMANPQAREAILDTMEALTRQDIARASVATRLANGELKRGQAEKEVRDLGDPLVKFREWRKANPQLFSDAVQGKASPTDTNKPAQSKLPTFASPSDVDAAVRDKKLKSGDKFIAGDGRERTVP